MNFRDEYKKEISEISPDEAALERIRSGVAKRLAEPEVAKKKPLPLRRIAVIGGSAAACLVIGVTAVMITGGGRISLDKTNNMNGGIAPAAGASGGMAGGANAAPDHVMSDGPEFNGANDVDSADQGGMQNAEGIMSSISYGDNIAGEYSPDASIPAGGAEAQEPSSPAAARITLDGDLLTLVYNGETIVFAARSDDGDSIGKDGETGLGVRPVLPAESTERIEVISSDGEIMFLELRDDEAVLFDGENSVLGVYVRVE